ncbi:MAG TPA: hypothetical protein VKT72_06270 [Candidatus Baltobacteraceae bacterium]|nr:hypothetical protein [Candidatus Baltobacteraceae bacterium]
MRTWVRVAAVVALVGALAFRVPAAASVQPDVRLDPARMFNPLSESLLARFFVPPPALSPIDVVLYDAPNPAVTAIAAPVQTTSGTSRVIAAVNLRGFAPPMQLPSVPLERPPVASVTSVQHAQLAQPGAISAPALAVGSDNYAPYAPPVQHVKESVNVPVRVGGIHFSGLVSGDQAQTFHPDAVRAMELCGTTDEAAACPYLHNQSMQNVAAGTAFDVRAGNRYLNLQLSGSVGRVSNGDVAMYQYAPLDPDTQLDPATTASPADSSLLYYPGLAQVVRHGLNAKLNVPVTPAVTIGLQYDRSHYQGDYSSLLLAPGLDATKDTYLGNVTYALPNSSSMLTLSARQYRYEDNLSNFSLTETRADLQFTVKF